MKTLTLKTVHRLLLANLLNEEGKKGGTLSEMKNYMDILGIIEFTDDEKTALELAVDMESSQVKWKPENEVDKVVELTDMQFDLLHGIIKNKNESKEISFEVLSPMLELAEMLDVEV